MKCKKCGGFCWELIWFKALMEENKEVNLYQCEQCKRLVMSTEDWRNSEEYV